MKKIYFVIITLLLSACGGYYPAELTDLGTATFIATRHGSETYQEVRPRRSGAISITKLKYYVVMETADGKYRYHKPAASLQKAMEEHGMRRRRPVSVERQVFEDPATGEIWFLEAGLTEEQAVEAVKAGRGYRQERGEE